jgi:hypothetical protein
MAPFQALLAREQGDDRGTNGTVCLFQHQHFPGSRGRRDSRALIGNLMVVSARDAAPAFRDASRSVSHGDGSLMEAFIKSLARSVRPSRISRQPTHRKSPSLSLYPLTVGAGIPAADQTSAVTMWCFHRPACRQPRAPVHGVVSASQSRHRLGLIRSFIIDFRFSIGSDADNRIFDRLKSMTCASAILRRLKSMT